MNNTHKKCHRDLLPILNPRLSTPMADSGIFEQPALFVPILWVEITLSNNAICSGIESECRTGYR